MKTEEISSVGTVLPDHFPFHHDAGHGWLEVPYNMIKNLSLESQISPYSYRKNETVYLEEDLDAVTFIRSYLEKIGKVQNDFQFFNTLCYSVYDGNTSQIRSYSNYTSNPAASIKQQPAIPSFNDRKRA